MVQSCGTANIYPHSHIVNSRIFTMAYKQWDNCAGLMRLKHRLYHCTHQSTWSHCALSPNALERKLWNLCLFIISLWLIACRMGSLAMYEHKTECRELKRWQTFSLCSFNLALYINIIFAFWTNPLFQKISITPLGGLGFAWNSQ